MDVEYQGDGGEDMKRRPFKGRRTVKEKYVRNACGQCRKACVSPFISAYQTLKAMLGKPSVMAQSPSASDARRRGTR